MDETGEVLTEQKARSVEGFRATLADLTSYRALKAKAAEGDEGVAALLLLVELRLGKVSFEDAKARAAKLEGLTERQSAEIEQLLVDREFTAIMNIRTRAEAATAMERVQAMFEAKRIPHGRDERLRFYDVLLRKADNDGDPKLFATALDEVKKLLGDDETFAETLKFLDTKLAELRAAAAAKKKAGGGKDGDG